MCLAPINYWQNIKKYGVKLKNYEEKRKLIVTGVSWQILKTKIKYYNNKIASNLKNVESNSTKQPKEGSKCICFSVIIIKFCFQIE